MKGVFFPFQIWGGVSFFQTSREGNVIIPLFYLTFSILIFLKLPFFVTSFFIFSVLGSDVIYNEEAVTDLVATLLQLSGSETTIFLAGELRNGKNSVVSSFCYDYCLNTSSCCRYYPWILSRSCNEIFHSWACGSDTVASRLLQQPCCFIHSSEEVIERIKISSLHILL